MIGVGEAVDNIVDGLFPPGEKDGGGEDEQEKGKGDVGTTSRPTGTLAVGESPSDKVRASGSERTTYSPNYPTPPTTHHPPPTRPRMVPRPFRQFCSLQPWSSLISLT